MYILEWPVTSMRMQFPTWVLQMQTPSRSGRRGGENYLYAGDAYLLKRQNNTINKMYPVEHKTPSSPNNS